MTARGIPPALPTFLDLDQEGGGPDLYLDLDRGPPRPWHGGPLGPWPGGAPWDLDLGEGAPQTLTCGGVPLGPWPGGGGPPDLHLGGGPRILTGPPPCGQTEILKTLPSLKFRLRAVINDKFQNINYRTGKDIKLLLSCATRIKSEAKRRGKVIRLVADYSEMNISNPKLRQKIELSWQGCFEISTSKGPL